MFRFIPVSATTMNLIQQLTKFDPESGQERIIFPITKVEALGDGVSIIYEIGRASCRERV